MADRTIVVKLVLDTEEFVVTLQAMIDHLQGTGARVDAPKRAKGGIISRPEGALEDDVPAELSGCALRISTAQYRRHGLAAMEKLNRGRMDPKDV